MIGLAAASLLVGCVGQPEEPTGTVAQALTQCTSAGIAEGVDVYDGNGTIDWNAVHGAGISFAIIKATQGTYNTQSSWGRNWAGARAAGVLRGAYHFFDPTQDGIAQAHHFLSVMGPLQPDDLPPMLDIECPDGDPNCLYTGAAGIAPGTTIHQRMMDWLNTVETATGRIPIIYTFGAYFTGAGVDTTGLQRYWLNIAYPTTTWCFNVPSPWPHATIWQWSWHGMIAGIPTEVDRDRFIGTATELRNWVTMMVSPNCSGMSNGTYCGAAIHGGTAGTLYHCTGGVATVDMACASGCTSSSPPGSDTCDTTTPDSGVGDAAVDAAAHDASTTDAPLSDASQTDAHDASSTDARGSGDAAGGDGSRDGGGTAGMPSGCGCSTPGRSNGGRALASLVVALGLVLATRRRSR
jgi:lysozyme